VSINIK